MSKDARQQAKDIQGAGLWNTLGLIQVLVEACALADSGSRNAEVVEIGRRAMEILDKAAALAPELVLIALDKLPVRPPHVIHSWLLIGAGSFTLSGRRHARSPAGFVLVLLTQRSHFVSTRLPPSLAAGLRLTIGDAVQLLLGGRE